MIDEPQHNLDGSSDAEPAPYQPEPTPPPYQPEPMAESLPPGQMFDHPPQVTEHELPPQDLQSPDPDAPAPEQGPYVSPFGQMPPPISQMPPPVGQMPPAAPAGVGTSHGMPHAWPTTPPVPAPRPMTQAVRSEFPLRTVLLVAVPLCIIGVIIAFILFNNSANEDVPPPTAPVATASPMTAPQATPAATTFAQGSGNGPLRSGGTANTGTSSAPTPPAAPVTLSGGGGGGQAAAGAVTNSGLAGRWVSKQADYYQFNADGSGSSGTQSQGKSTQNFNWTVADHQISLFPQQGGNSQQQTLTFNFGSSTNSVFLKQSDGRYREYTLVKTTDAGG